MIENEADGRGRKTYYVSVQSGQILEDQQAAAYELEVALNEEEHIKLRELFDELASMDEAQTFHFAHSPYGSAGDSEMNAGYDELIVQIYKKLYEHGSDTTKRHIESMQLL
ncbi:hypothetical protein L1N85_02685 [Paenibacillus alkaliterrae]|uniref:hypothetical protein n=1 Tax=Paenibacillus alkaliterrae TaxID=320909 RepID=UPI001F3B3D6D|nr:hypothetical protein [Paenibacillus alkaliterrae]MCF2937333.1 hypothetical protein [Paenibacillus alkaliterrae]